MYANKQDLPNAKSVSEVTQALQLTELKGRKWFVQGCCGPSGQVIYYFLFLICSFLTREQGLYEGLDWLSAEIGRRHGAQ